MKPVKIVAIRSPGRLPTVVHDLGPAWNHLRTQGFHCQRWSASHTFWRVLCDPAVSGLLPRSSPNLLGSVRSKMTRWTIAASGRVASDGLDALARREAMFDKSLHATSLGAIETHCARLSHSQSESAFSTRYGMTSKVSNLDDSGELITLAERTDSFVGRVVERVAEATPAEADLALVAVGSAQELFAAAALVTAMKRRRPSLHVCLWDHAYENFSLHAHLPELDRHGALTRIFDSVIASKDERDALVVLLAERLAAGRDTRGYLRLKDFPLARRPSLAPNIVQDFEPTFAAQPILWTRVSSRRCYWSRCSFCVQNEKYEDVHAPSKTELVAVRERLAALRKSGWENLIFSDEALSPAMLRGLAEGLMEDGTSLSWACRSKMELAHGAELFRLLANAGCYEVLFGLESISERVQKLMDKHVPGLDRAAMRQRFSEARTSRVGVHINLIAGFPGDTLSDCEESIDFVVDVSEKAPNTTALLNPFALFPGTPIAADPARWGIAVDTPTGDMPTVLGFRTDDVHSEAIYAAVPALKSRLYSGLGQDAANGDAAEQLSHEFLTGSGHGALLKADILVNGARSQSSA